MVCEEPEKGEREFSGQWLPRIIIRGIPAGTELDSDWDDIVILHVKFAKSPKHPEPCPE